MIAESLVYARSFLRTTRAFRRYLVDAVGLWSRGERQLRAWTPHILPRPSDRWLWEVAPFGEEAPDTRRVHSVLAYPDWHAACKARSD